MPETLYAVTTTRKALEKPFAEHPRVLARDLLHAVLVFTHGKTSFMPHYVRSQIGQWYRVQLTSYTTDGEHLAGDIRLAAESLLDLAKSADIYPIAGRACQECGTDHPPEQPHNPQQLRYHYTFYRRHDRWPTWWDALEHCPPEVRQTWIDLLARAGVTVEDPNKDHKLMLAGGTTREN